MSKIDDYAKLCDVGDTFYRVCNDRIRLITIAKVEKMTLGHYVYEDNDGHSYFNRALTKSCFKTEEEAKNEIQRRKKIKEKRNLLKEYERKLNKELGLKDHFVIL